MLGFRWQEERTLIRIDDSFRKVIVGRNNIRKWNLNARAKGIFNFPRCDKIII